MARRKKQAATPEEQAMTEGLPEDGSIHPEQQFEDSADPNLITDQDDPGDADDPPTEPTAAQLQAQMLEMERRHSEEMASVRRAQPPSEPKPDKKVDGKEDEELEGLLFSNPKEAIKRIRQGAVEQAQTILTAQYQRDQATQKFWREFDRSYPDLAQDRDLVEMTMNANLAQLTNIPVERAMEKVAELTRNRIRRYTGQKQKPQRAVAEGAQPPTPARAPAAPERIPSLTDIVRARRAKRLGKASAA